MTESGSATPVTVQALQSSHHSQYLWLVTPAVMNACVSVCRRDTRTKLVKDASERDSGAVEVMEERMESWDSTLSVVGSSSAGEAAG